MKTFILITIMIFICIIFSLISFYIGAKYAYNSVRTMDFKDYYIDLKHSSLDKNSMLYQYLKGKYYYLSRSVSDNTLKNHLKDLGKIDTEILRGVPYGHEAIPEADYDDFKKRYNKLKENQ